MSSFLDMVFDGKPSRDWIAHWNELYDTRLGSGMVKAAMAPYANPPAIQSGPLPLASYAGTYANDYVGEARVEDAGSELVLRLGPAGRRFSLRHFNRDIFLYAPNVETPGWLSPIAFTIGADGKASGVTIEDLNADGLGVLARADKR